MVRIPYEACVGLTFLIWQVIVAFEEARLDSRLAARSLREAYRVKREAQFNATSVQTPPNNMDQK